MSAQRDLSTAESNLITAMAAYEQSKVSMDTATGLLLTNLGIDLQDAVTGQVQKLPQVPNVVPSASVTAAPAVPLTATPQAQPDAASDAKVVIEFACHGRDEDGSATAGPFVFCGRSANVRGICQSGFTDPARVSEREYGPGTI